MKEKRFQYQRQNSKQTLIQGLNEYKKGHPELLKEKDISAQAADFFHSHDICHVIFGLDTDLGDEVLSDIWTIFGTDVTFKTYFDFIKIKEARDILAEIGIRRSVLEFFKALPRITRIFMNTRMLNQKWPWRGKQQNRYLRKTLAEIRSEFNIRILS